LAQAHSHFGSICTCSSPCLKFEAFWLLAVSRPCSMPFFGTIFKGIKTAGVGIAVGATLGQHRGLKRELEDQAKNVERTAKRECRAAASAGKTIGHAAATAGTAIAVAATLGQNSEVQRAMEDQAKKVVKEGAGAVPAFAQLVPGMGVAAVVHEIIEENVKATGSDYEGVRTLYHHTSSEAADSILDSQHMRLGPNGEMGKGIYFATSAADARRKAMHGGQGGVTLEAQVDLGYCRRFNEHDRNWHCIMRGLSASRIGELKKQGFSSIALDRNNGREYAVYESSRVSSIRRAP